MHIQVRGLTMRTSVHDYLVSSLLDNKLDQTRQFISIGNISTHTAQICKIRKATLIMKLIICIKKAIVVQEPLYRDVPPNGFCKSASCAYFLNNNRMLMRFHKINLFHQTIA